MTTNPIAIFTYNRPNHTDRLLDSLARNARLEACNLFIFCDGPRKPDHIAGVEASRRVVRQWAGRLGAQVIERAENLGLARSIAGGVSDLCAQYGRVIVLEDDMVLSPDFLNYMLQGLDRYQDDPAVYQISGHMFPVAHPARPATFFLPLTTTLGWATWDRAWQVFSWEPPGVLDHLGDADFRRLFDLDGCYPYSAMLEQRLAGLNDSWAILWWYTVFTLGGLVLYPRVSLVQNLGFDGTGVHSGTSSVSRSASMSPGRLPDLLDFPSTVETNEAAFNRVKAYLRALSQPSPRQASVAARIRHRIRRMIP